MGKFLLVLFLLSPIMSMNAFASPQTFVDIKTDKSDYLFGEPVTITVKNMHSYPIQFSDSSMGLKITNYSGDNLLDCFYYLQMITSLDPNEEYERVWDPLNDCPGKNTRGLIHIYVTYYDEAYDEQITRSYAIRIDDGIVTPNPDLNCDFSEGPIYMVLDKENYQRDNLMKIDVCFDMEYTPKDTHVLYYDENGEKVYDFYPLTPHTKFTITQYLADDIFSKNGTYTVEIDAHSEGIASKSFVVPEFETISVLILIIGISIVIYLMKKFKPVSSLVMNSK